MELRAGPPTAVSASLLVSWVGFWGLLQDVSVWCFKDVSSSNLPLLEKSEAAWVSSSGFATFLLWVPLGCPFLA